jgi:hypothetical protein
MHRGTSLEENNAEDRVYVEEPKISCPKQHVPFRPQQDIMLVQQLFFSAVSYNSKDTEHATYEKIETSRHYVHVAKIAAIKTDPKENIWVYMSE